VSWHQPDYLAYVKPHLDTVHRTLRTAIRAEWREQARCQRDHGTGAYLQIRTMALRAGRDGPYSELDDAELDAVSDVVTVIEMEGL